MYKLYMYYRVPYSGGLEIKAIISNFRITLSYFLRLRDKFKGQRLAIFVYRLQGMQDLSQNQIHLYLPSFTAEFRSRRYEKFWQARTVYLIMYIYVAITVQETQFIATPVSRGPHNILLLDTQFEHKRLRLVQKSTLQTNIGTVLNPTQGI